MLAQVHRQLRQLLHADNLIVASFDPVREAMRVLYYVDHYSPDALHENAEYTVEDFPDSLTLALMRYGHPFHGSSLELLQKMGLGRDRRLGQQSEDWMGVPMMDDHRVHGAIVTQSYDSRHHYDDRDLTTMVLVAQHTLLALRRQQANHERENRIREQTRNLREDVETLRSEVTELRHGRDMQTALFRIAELSSDHGNLEDFYSGLHQTIGQLLDARNFLIALLTDAGQLAFTYLSDGHYQANDSDEINNAICRAVMRSRKPLLADTTQLQTLLKADEETGSKLPKCWLGVPLLMDDQCLGVVAVQSYTARRYTTEDRDILLFASQHIATALERKRSRESLRQANIRLEARVQQRTHDLEQLNAELRAQIDVRQQAETRLEHQALHDALTGLPNRTALLRQLAQAVRKYHEHGDAFALLYVDLDRFKIINDSVGHSVGDEVLLETGQRLANCIRGKDFLARLGGDEFAILLNRIQGTADARAVARSVLDSLLNPIHVDDKELYTSASIGIALARSHYRQAEELLRDADVAMHRAKVMGRKRYELFSSHLHEHAVQVLDLENDLQRALTRDEFLPYLQPIVRLDNGQTVGHEALLRWRHPERGILTPGQFLNAAEESGTIEQIDWLLFNHVCNLLAVTSKQLGHVHINVSARHFRMPHLADQLLQMLDNHDISADCIRVEVTEDVLLDDPEQARRTMLQLHEAGVLTVMDDFGTGYSSLSYLHQFPLHALKIDRAFVQELGPGQTETDTAVVRAILAMANSLGMEVVAEGIETEAQQQALLQLGCHYGQGFLYGHPQPVSDVEMSTH